MPQPTPSPDPQPVLIVSDGEQGDKLIKMTAPATDAPVEPPGQVEQTDPAAEAASAEHVSTNQND